MYVQLGTSEKQPRDSRKICNIGEMEVINVC